MSQGHRKGWNTSPCPTISRMTVTLLTSQSAPTATDADVLVIGVFQGADGPVPATGTDEFDLMAALTALGATGKLEELTKVHTAGRLAAGAAARDLASGRAKRVALALPAGQPDEAEAVALGALLGSYAFRKYRTTASTARDVEHILH